MANIAVNLWGHDLWQQWKTQSNIPAASEMEHKPIHVSGNDIIGYYKKTVMNHSGSIKKHRTTAKLSEVRTFKMVN